MFQRYTRLIVLLLSLSLSSIANLSVKNASVSSQTSKEPMQHVRESRQGGFFQWLFGPPIKPNEKAHENLDENGTTIHSYIYHQLNHNRENLYHTTSHPKEAESVATTPEKFQRSEIVAYSPPTPPEIVTNQETNNMSSFDIVSKGKSLPKPRPRALPYEPHRNLRQINDPNVNSDPSQINLQREMDPIDRFEKNLTENRNKRETSSKFRQLNIPYGHEQPSITSSNNRINTLSKRQLLLSPVDQQMFALRQQQELAAATMLQQQQLLGYNRYNNRFIDDYYDDDSSYEDSDEYYENFNRYGMGNPFLGGGMRYGARIPPINHPYGIGRRSLPDTEESKDEFEPGPSPKQNVDKAKPHKKLGKIESLLGPISKAGRWDTFEDYDLYSDFNKMSGKNGMGSRSGVKHLGESHKELDEEESDENGDSITGDFLYTEKGRSSLSMEREDINSTQSPSTISSNSTNGESSPEVPTTHSSTTNRDPETPEQPTTTPLGSTASSEEETTTISKPTSTMKPLPTLPTNPEQEQLISTTAMPDEEDVEVPPFHQTLNCRCGMQSVRMFKDVGDGTILRTMINPWLVGVRTKQKHLCSGSIVNNKYILTSKKCVHGLKGLIVTAGMGSGLPKNFSVIRVNEHPSKNIALLKVKPTISPSFAMRPICLPIRNHRSLEKANLGTGTLVTFKRHFPKSNSGLQLVQTEVPLLSNAKCVKATGISGSATMICPGLPVGPPGSMKCGGDSGGLLQVYYKGYSYEQIGVVSTTVGCRSNKTAGVYTDVRSSMKWILYGTKDARYCRKPKVTRQDLINTILREEETDEEQESREEEQDQDE